jgi:hypothetical protein
MPLDEVDQSEEAVQQSDQEADRVKPWTIKGIPPEERNAAIAAAERNELTIGEWMVLAIRTRIQAERSDHSPVPVTPTVQQSDPRSDLADIERMIAMARDLSSVTGEPPPKSVSRLAYRGRNSAAAFWPHFKYITTSWCSISTLSSRRTSFLLRRGTKANLLYNSIRKPWSNFLSLSVLPKRLNICYDQKDRKLNPITVSIYETAMDIR